MNPFPKQKAGLFRPRVPRRVPKQIPDEAFNELFARLPSNRDRALVAFWISTGARASELLGAVCPGADPGQQLITVIRKGSRAMQALPASPDAFVWLRLYQQARRPAAVRCRSWTGRSAAAAPARRWSAAGTGSGCDG
jgi:site-specific recombinase XerC